VVRVELVQQDLWLEKRLKPTRSGYNRTLCCMEGTRESILNEITAWVTNGSGPSNTYWIYGLPGIGKTSLAHSICQTLDERNQLVGAFFCQRDDTNSSEPRNILPTLIYKLAEISPSFRRIVAERLRSNQT
jgi:Cdc6-like AAA superfamily ATPase